MASRPPCEATDFLSITFVVESDSGFYRGILDISRNKKEFCIESGSPRSTIIHLHRMLVWQKNKIKVEKYPRIKGVTPNLK